VECKAQWGQLAQLALKVSPDQLVKQDHLAQQAQQGLKEFQDHLEVLELKAHQALLVRLVLPVSVSPQMALKAHHS
jgi:hypothetical protein